VDYVAAVAGIAALVQAEARRMSSEAIMALSGLQQELVLVVGPIAHIHLVHNLVHKPKIVVAVDKAQG